MSVAALGRHGIAGRPNLERAAYAVARNVLQTPSTRSSTGFASAPVPRMTDRYAFFETGWITRSLMDMDAASVPSSAAISLVDGGYVGRAGLATRRLRAKLERIDRRRLRIGGKQHARRTEREYAERLRGHSRLLRRSGRLRQHLSHRGDSDHEGEHSFNRFQAHATSSCPTNQSSPGDWGVK